MSVALAYIHPVWQLVGILSMLMAATWGLRLRSAHRKASGIDSPSLQSQHVRLGTLAVAFIIAGAFCGLVSMPLFRGEGVFGTWHAWLGLAIGILLGLGGYYGWKLHTSPTRRAPWSRDEARELHVFCMTLGLFLSLAEIVMGFPLLP
jgi:hypothetical protein